MTVTIYDLHTWSKTGGPSNGVANKINFGAGAGQQYVYEGSVAVPGAGSYEFVVEATSVGGWNAGKKMVWVTNKASTGFDWTNSAADWDGELDGTTNDQTLRLPFTTTSSGNVSIRVGPGATSSGNQLAMTVGFALDDAPVSWSVDSVDDATPQSGDTIRISCTGLSGSGVTIADNASTPNAWTVTAQTTTYVDVTVPNLPELSDPEFDFGDTITLTVTDGGDSGTIDVVVSATTGDEYGTLSVASGSFPAGSLFESATGLVIGDKSWASETSSTSADIDPTDGSAISVEQGTTYDYAFYDVSDGHWSNVFSRAFGAALDTTPDAISLDPIENAEPGSTVQFNSVLVSGIDSGVDITPVITGDIPNIEWSVNAGAFGTSATVSNGDTLDIRGDAPALFSDQPSYVQGTLLVDLNGVTAQGTVDTRLNGTPVLSAVTIRLTDDMVATDLVVDLASYLQHDDSGQTVTYASTDTPGDFTLASDGKIRLAVDYANLAESVYAFVVTPTDDSGAPTDEGSGAVITVMDADYVVPATFVSFMVNGRIARRRRAGGG